MASVNGLDALFPTSPKRSNFSKKWQSYDQKRQNFNLILTLVCADAAVVLYRTDIPKKTFCACYNGTKCYKVLQSVTKCYVSPPPTITRAREKEQKRKSKLGPQMSKPQLISSSTPSSPSPSPLTITAVTTASVTTVTTGAVPTTSGAPVQTTPLTQGGRGSRQGSPSKQPSITDCLPPEITAAILPAINVGSTRESVIVTISPSQSQNLVIAGRNVFCFWQGWHKIGGETGGLV
eukprot:sb/3469283/